MSTDPVESQKARLQFSSNALDGETNRHLQNLPADIDPATYQEEAAITGFAARRKLERLGLPVTAENLMKA